jgi:broad specificity phosphatase PhoE
MKTSSLIIVRHGRTAFNAQGLLQGRVDNPLDSVGEEQASAVGSYLAPILNDEVVIISSPLLRARSTAAAIVEGTDIDVIVDDRWTELSYGVYEGVPQGEVPAEVWNRWRSDPHFAPDSGETLAQVQDRVAQACEELLGSLDGRTAVIVSHVSPIKSAVAWALGVDVGVSWRTQLDTASISRITLTGRGPVLRSFNELPAGLR